MTCQFCYVQEAVLLRLAAEAIEAPQYCISFKKKKVKH